MIYFIIGIVFAIIGIIIGLVFYFNKNSGIVNIPLIAPQIPPELPSLTPSQSKNLVQSRVWQTGTNDFKSHYFDDLTRDMFTSGSTVIFPEKCIIPKCNDPNRVALSFSGGGTIQLVSLIGYIRGLRSLGVFEKTNYISTSSGGSWFAGLYLFARNNGYSSDELLGRYIPPENLTIKNLNNINFERSQESNNFIGHRRPIIDETIFEDTVKKLLTKFKIEDNWFVYYVQDQFLNHYKLNKPIALNKSYADQINKNNGTNMEFNVLADDDPFWVCNGSILNKDLVKLCKIEFTPLYSGILNKFRIRDTKNTIGGYVVETFAFNQGTPTTNLQYQDYNLSSSNYCTTENLKTNFLKINTPFKLADVMGVTANAYGIPLLDLISKLNLKIDIIDLKFFTNYNIWKSSLNNNFIENKEITLTDGQGVDASGITSLLARGVKRIITFLYCEGKLFDSNGNPTLYTNGNICLTPYSNYSIPHLFGIGRYTCLTSPSGTQVFNENDYPDFVERLRSNYLKGGATFARKTLTVKPNALLGIKGNYDVDLLVICTEDSPRFKNSLPQLTRTLIDIDLLRLRFAGFPRYPIFFPNPVTAPNKILQLTKEQVNLLSCYTNWCILQPELSSEILDMYKDS